MIYLPDAWLHAAQRWLPRLGRLTLGACNGIADELHRRWVREQCAAETRDWPDGPFF